MSAVAPREKRILLYQGPDLAKLDELLDAVNRAAIQPESSSRLGDVNASYEEARSTYEEFLPVAAERATPLVVCEIGWRKWRAIEGDETHAARTKPDGEMVDEDRKAGGFNAETFPIAAVSACMIEPTFGTVDEREEFLDSLSEAKLMDAYRAAYLLNKVSASDPKDWHVFEPTPASDD